MPTVIPGMEVSQKSDFHSYCGQEPKIVGVDPFNPRIDRNSDDNLTPVMMQQGVPDRVFGCRERRFQREARRPALLLRLAPEQSEALVFIGAVSEIDGWNRLIEEIWL